MGCIERWVTRVKVQFVVWVKKYGLVINFFYRCGDREVVISEMQPRIK